MNVSVSSQLSNEGSVTDSGVLLTDTLLMVVLTLYGDGSMWEECKEAQYMLQWYDHPPLSLNSQRKYRDRVPTWHSTVGNGRHKEMLQTHL